MFYWHVPRHFDEVDLLFIGGCILAFVCGSVLLRAPSARRARDPWGRFDPREVGFLLMVFRLGLGLTLFGYAIWFFIGFRNGLTPQLAGEALIGRGGAAYETKALLTTVPGITTMIQFEMGVFIIGLVLCFNGHVRQVLGWLVALFFIIVIRSILNDERLAIIEILAPSTCLLTYYYRRPLSFLLRGPVSLAWPFLAVLVIYLIFTATEYGRAWTTFYADQGEYGSVWEFTLMRLVGYYVTALNNGAQMYAVMGPREIPYATFQCFWKFPIVGGALYAKMGVREQDSFFDMESSEVNPEFNNFSAVYDFALDWTEIGAVVFFFVAGFAVFYLYRLFIRGHLTGVLLYPLVFVGILEIARTLYWTNSRTFPSWMLLLLAIAGIKWLGRRRLRLTRSESMEARQVGPAWLREKLSRVDPKDSAEKPLESVESKPKDPQ
jgi:hypothetical protein